MSPKRIQLKRPNKEKYLRNIENIDSVDCYEKIRWLTESGHDIIFYRDEGDRIIEYTIKSMKVSLEQNWEVRPSEQ
jgi:hypothetical protein